MVFNEIICQLPDFLTKQNWPSILQGIGAIWVAIVATCALTQWKKQIKLQKQLAFVDRLTDEIHNFILAASPLLSAIKFTKIGFESYQNTNCKYKKCNNNGAISYIEANGKQDSLEMVKQIDVLRGIMSKIRSLSAKGQVYDISNYKKAQTAISIIEHVYGQLEAFAYFIGKNSLNWSHPDVQKRLNSIVKIDEELISKNLAVQNREYLKFAQELYKII